MKIYQLIFFLFLINYSYSQKTMPNLSRITAIETTDFDITGDGNSENWQSANWINIEQRSNLNFKMETKVKVLYSKSGIYFLYKNQDSKINASITENGKWLWTEDVVEVFIWTDTKEEVYFEYELSPLNYDLPLLIMNIEGKPHRWQAWYYEDDRKIQHKTAIRGGKKESGASIESWTAEFFIPYSLLSSMKQVPPSAGTEWRINFNRMDYLNDKVIYWSWQDLPESFHEINKFGSLVFK
jgi:hypothetical protein